MFNGNPEKETFFFSLKIFNLIIFPEILKKTNFLLLFMKKILSTGCALFLFLGIINPLFSFHIVSEAAETATAPLRVEGLSVIPDDGKAVLLWDTLSLPSGTKVKDYTVFWGTKSVSEGLSKEYENTKPASDASVDSLGIVKYTVTGLKNGTKYFFAVKPIAEGVTATYSREVFGTPTQDVSALPPYVKDVEPLTKNLLKLTMSKKVVLPTEAPEVSFTITEKGDDKKIVEVKKVSLKTNYFLTKDAKAGEDVKSKEIKSEEFLYIETPDQVKGKEYLLTVSATIKDEANQPVSSGATDSDYFTAVDTTEIPATERESTNPPASPSATPTTSTSASPSPSATPLPNVLYESKGVPEGKTKEALVFSDGNVKVSFLSNSLSGVLLLREEKEEFAKAFASDKNKKFVEKGYIIAFEDQEKRTFSAEVTFSYTDEELSSKKIDEKKLVVLTSEDGKKWEEKIGKVDESKNSITISTSQFSYWTLAESQNEALHSAAEVKDTTPPEDVTELVATFKAQITDFLVTLSWKKSLNTAGDIMTQLLYVSKDKGKTWETPSDIGKDKNTTSVKGLPDTEYTFKITTKDKQGNESTGAISSLRLPALPATGAPLFIALGIALMGAGILKTRRKKS